MEAPRSSEKNIRSRTMGLEPEFLPLTPQPPITIIFAYCYSGPFYRQKLHMLRRCNLTVPYSHPPNSATLEERISVSQLPYTILEKAQIVPCRADTIQKNGVARLSSFGPESTCGPGSRNYCQKKGNRGRKKQNKNMLASEKQCFPWSSTSIINLSAEDEKY